MANNHTITKQIGNLRGFSTDNSFVRPSNVADKAINIQRAPGRSLQLRRGYQCQISSIGGMGIGTFDDPTINEIHTVTIGTDGFLYNKLTKQIFFEYDGRVTGDITGASQANPCNILSVGHGLATGAQLIINNVEGMTELNNTTYTITFVDVDNYTLDGINSTAFTAYTTGGEWSIAFADQRYLTFTIFTDPRYINTNPGWSVQEWSIDPWGAPSGESITCNITVNRAAQIDGDQAATNTMIVKFGHEIAATDIIQFSSSTGVFNERTVTSVTNATITFAGSAVSLTDGVYVSQFFDIPFRKGFDVTSPYLISTFISTITNATNGVSGLLVSINGDDNFAAAFIQIIEPTIIDSNSLFSIDYWYWETVNFTSSPPFPGSANIAFQNSKDFEIASFSTYDDVIYMANGWDYPQKYDGQTVYRVGMPQGIRPNAADNVGVTIKPFSTGNVYEYAITYEQVDNRGHIVEGEVSEVWEHTVGATPSAIDVFVTNLQASSGKNWNTNTALAAVGTAIIYGPDSDGFYYNLLTVTAGYTLNIGDSGYYLDTTCAIVDGAQASVVTVNVDAVHGVVAGDIVYFEDTTPNQIVRDVTGITPTSITFSGDPVTVADNAEISAYKTSKVFGNVSIVNGAQTDVTVIVVDAGHTIQVSDIASFTDISGNIQRRTISAIAATTITIEGNPVTVEDQILISSENQRATAINLRRLNAGGASFTASSPISNNLRINIYRTNQGETFNVSGEIFLVASIPNNGLGAGTQTYLDGIADVELGREFDNPDFLPNPPPISKYLLTFKNQLLYAGGERGNSENSDFVFFSEGNNPESVPLATNSFIVPSVDDDVTGIGVSGATLVTTKNNSLWGLTGSLLTGQIDVFQIAPGANIGCVAHATIASVGSLMYFLHTNGVYAIAENQLFPTDPFGNPVPLSLAIDTFFRETNFLPQTKYVLTRAVAINYTKDNQYLLFLPAEDSQSTIRTANTYSTILCYDYQEKNWFQWTNMNAAGGMFVIDDDLYFQERRFSGVDGNTANIYKQHRFYRVIDHADHAGPQRCEWRSSWEDLGQPEVRKKFSRCILLMDRVSDLQQINQPDMNFSSYLDRIPNLQNTLSKVTTVDNVRNSSWSFSGWGWNFWSGYQDSFVSINLKRGTVAKSIQVGFTIQGINMDIKLSGFQLEAIPENRTTVVR